MTNVNPGVASSSTNNLVQLMLDISTGIVYAQGVSVGILSSNLKGTTTNDNAPTGYVGEIIVSTVGSGGAQSLTSPSGKTVTSMLLTAGDWDVDGTVDYTFGATTSITLLACGVSDTANTLLAQTGSSNVGTDPNTNLAQPASIPTAQPYSQATPTVRVSIAVSTTIYLVAQATFTASTIAAYGTLRARRVR
jgi:hypothetical protein